MLCMKCGSACEREDRYCRQCGASLSAQFGHVEPEDPARSTPALGRVDIKPFYVRGRRVTVDLLYWPSLAVCVLIGLGFLSTWGSGLAYAWFAALFVVGLVFKPVNDLRRVRFGRLWGSTNLESDDQGDVFITRLGGECPLCRGELKLRTIGGGYGQYRNKPVYTLVQCTDQRDHHWYFDPLALHPLRHPSP